MKSNGNAVNLKTIIILFFLSGISGLVYEVVWVRMLALIFGSTVYATTTVLVAYMGGLSIGSYFGGKVVDRFQRPVRFYGICELGIGGFALLFSFMVDPLNSFYVTFYHHFIPTRLPFITLRFIIISVLLMVPTSLMGATLPALSKGIVKNRANAGSYTGFLYAVNTIGAVSGVILAAFISIEKLGLRSTIFAAAMLNILIALTVIILTKNRAFYAKQQETVIQRDTPITSNKFAPFSVFIYAVSGFCALSLEVLWTRELVFLLGMDTYAFATMLSVFLFGIGIGSIIMSGQLKRVKNPIFLLGVCEAGIGITTLLNFMLIPHLYTYKQSLFANLGTGIFSFVLSGYIISLLLMIIPTLLMGSVFPIVAHIYSGSLKKIGRSIGKIYSFNTLGSILGSLISGFLLIPFIGVANSFKIIILINITLGIIALFFAKYKRKIFRIVPVFLIALAGLAFVIIPFNKSLVAYSYIMNNPDNKLLYYSEDAYAAVSVIDIPGIGRRLYVDSGLAADTSRFDMPSHKIIVHLPLLLQQNPKKALVIGFGMGETSYSITTHGVQVDAVEISKGAIAANRYFLDVNHDILHNPLFNLTIDDGRNYLLTHNNRYDLISVGIIHPGISSNGAGFYGSDFYRLCMERLTPEGIVSQWVPTHGLSLEAFKIVIKTFIEVFPYTTLWFKFTDNFIVLLGSQNPFVIDYENFLKNMSKNEVMEDLETVDMTNPLVLLDSFWMDEEELSRFANAARETSDDRPILEFMSTKSINNSGIENLEALADKHIKVIHYLTNIPDSEKIEEELNTIYSATKHMVRAQIYKKRFQFDESISEFDRALEIYPYDNNTKYLRDHTVEIYFNKLLIKAEEYYKINEINDAITLYKKAASLKPESSVVYNFLGICYSRIGDHKNALRALKTAIVYDIDNFQYHFNLASLLATIGDYHNSREELEMTLKLNPHFKKAEEALETLNSFLESQ